MKPLLVSIRNIFGNEKIYPQCAKSRLFAELARPGQKTLTKREIEIIKELGFEFEVIPERKTV